MRGPKTEAIVRIDGTLLTEAEVASIRVAVTSFLTELLRPESRSALGPIGDAYEARLRDVESLLVTGRRAT